MRFKKTTPSHSLSARSASVYFFVILGSFLAMSIHMTHVWSADHILLDGTQIGQGSYRLKITGFIQPRATLHLAEPLDQLTASNYSIYNGQYALPNLSDDHSWGFNIARARVMMRGSLPHSMQKVNYLLAVEMGRSIYTRGETLVVTDIASTFSYIPGVRLRIGQFKLPTMEEIVQPVESHQEFITFSNTLETLLGESPIKNGEYQGAHYNFRDRGLQAFDTFALGSSFAISYAGMVAMGHRPNPNASHHPDLIARASLSWITKGKLKDIKRKDVNVGAWYMQGKRMFEDEEIKRIRQGAFLKVEQGAFWVLAEWVQGSNMTEIPNLIKRDHVEWAKHSQTTGIVLQGGPRFTISNKYGEIGLKTRLEQLTHQQGDPNTLQIFQSLTAGLEWKPISRLRIQYEYQMRKLETPNRKDDVSRLKRLGDQMLLQATLLF